MVGCRIVGVLCIDGYTDSVSCSCTRCMVFTVHIVHGILAYAYAYTHNLFIHTYYWLDFYIYKYILIRRIYLPNELHTSFHLYRSGMVFRIDIISNGKNKIDNDHGDDDDANDEHNDVIVGSVKDAKKFD